MRRQPFCSSPARVTASLLLSFLAATTATQLPVLPPTTPPHPHIAERDFSLRHVFHHGTYKHPGLHRRLDVSDSATVWMAGDDDDDEHAARRQPVPRLRVKAEPMSIQRLADRSKPTIDGILDWGRRTGKAVQLAAHDWTIDDIAGPNVTDKETVLSFAHMAADAYVIDPATDEWYDVGGGFNYTNDFGWQSDGLRGHIFADTENRTVVIGLKGTTPAMFDGSDTTTNDKINDNLFFSCCCGQGGQFLWRQVCDCQTDAYTCNSTCLVTAMREKNRYYYAAQDLYHNVTALYPDADIWMAGHSLGGAVSSFISLTYGHPAVTFEAVPEAMPASRLGLPVPPGHQIGSLQQRTLTAGFHFGHTADPVYMGSCNKATSVCTFAGYAMQSVCHTGKKCVYDTVKDLGWRVGIGTHKIVEVIRDVIEKYDQVAKCEPYNDCTDCYPWEYFESNGTETTTRKSTTAKPTKTSTSTYTRTETCKTPGWWGCLDETTTTAPTITTTTTSTSTSTSTCKTPGWFGCRDGDETTTTTTTSSADPAPSPTTTLLSPTITTSSPTITTSSPTITTSSPTITTSSPTITTSSPTSTTPSSTSSCQYPGWFGGCLDGSDPPLKSHTATPKPTSFSTTATSSSASSCQYPGWFGGCLDGSDPPSKSHTATHTPTSFSTTCTNEGWFGLICHDKSSKEKKGQTSETSEKSKEHTTERMEM